MTPLPFDALKAIIDFLSFDEAHRLRDTNSAFFVRCIFRCVKMLKRDRKSRMPTAHIQRELPVRYVAMYMIVNVSSNALEVSTRLCSLAVIVSLAPR